MAGISKTLELQDRFSSTLDRWINGIKKAVEGSGALDAATDKLIRSQAELNLAQQEWNDLVIGTANIGNGMVGTIENAVDTFRALAEQVAEGDARFLTLENALPMVTDVLAAHGLEWAEMADDIDKTNLLLTKTPKQLEKLGYLVKKTEEEVEEANDEVERTEKVTKRAHTALEGLGKKLISIGALFFTGRKLLQYMRQDLERAPDKIAEPFKKLADNIRDIRGRAMVSLLDAMHGSMERLNAAMESPAGQKFIEVLSKIGYIIGTVVGGAIDLLVQLIGQVIDAFGQMGISAQNVLDFIVGLASSVYVTLYNIVATLWNFIASFAEFLYNTFTGRATLGQAIITFVWRIADAVLGFLQTIGEGIDWVLAKLGVETGVGGWIGGLKDQAQGKLNDSLAGNDNYVQFKRMELLNYEENAQNWQSKVNEFDPMALQLKAINQNTRSAARSAASIDKSLQDADIKALVDVATRKFVSNVNLTSQTPVITVNGANTGNTQQDRINLANTIRDILLEQLAVGSTAPISYGA